MQRLVLCVLALACQRELTVPAQVPPPSVTLKSFSPDHGYAGARVTIAGTELGRSATDTEVRFGTSLPVAPLSVSADGTSIVAAVPDDASDGAITVTAPK